MSILWENYRELFLSGVLTTVQLTLLGCLFGTLAGVVVATFRISPIAPLRAVGLIYAEVFRNVPLMSLIILIVYALPEIDITLSFEVSVTLALSLVGGAFIAEALRSGINGVPVGQIEAARSIGLGFGGVLRLVVLPQAFRAMVQPLTSVYIAIFLSSSLAGVVGMQDLTAVVSRINTREGLGLVTFGVAAAIYVAISLTIAGVGSTLEKRMRMRVRR